MELERIEEVLTYMNTIKQRLTISSKHTSPFPWLEVENFLPEDLFVQINRYFPTADQMGAMPRARTSNAYAHKYRQMFPVSPDSLNSVEPRSRAFWSSFYRLTQDLIPDLMSALPEPDKTHKFLLLPSDMLRARVDLWSDRGGYQIKPHTDAPHKLATFLLYCSEDASLVNEGTAIYSPRDRQKRCWRGAQWPVEEFDLVYKTNYGRNKLFGFRKTDKSFHGKPSVPESVTERRTVAITIQTSSAFSLQQTDLSPVS